MLEIHFDLRISTDILSHWNCIFNCISVLFVFVKVFLSYFQSFSIFKMENVKKNTAFKDVLCSSFGCSSSSCHCHSLWSGSITALMGD